MKAQIPFPEFGHSRAHLGIDWAEAGTMSKMLGFFLMTNIAHFLLSYFLLFYIFLLEALS